MALNPRKSRQDLIDARAELREQIENIEFDIRQLKIEKLQLTDELNRILEELETT